MSTTNPSRTGDEIAQLGHSIYEQQVKPQLSAEDEDKFVAIDINTGDYEVNEDARTAVMRLRERQPSPEVWLERAGWPAAHSIGAPELRTVGIPLEAIAERGHKIYTDQIKPHLTPEDDNKYVVIDIHTNDYEIDADDLAASERLRERQPSAVLWVERAGWPTTERIGFR